MRKSPPPVLVDTWLHVVYSKEDNIARQKFELHRIIKEYFGSIGLAQLYVEQSKSEEMKIYYF